MRRDEAAGKVPLPVQEPYQFPIALVERIRTPGHFEVELGRERALEGDVLDVVIRLEPGDGAEQVDVLLELPPGL